MCGHALPLLICVVQGGPRLRFYGSVERSGQILLPSARQGGKALTAENPIGIGRAVDFERDMLGGTIDLDELSGFELPCGFGRD